MLFLRKAAITIALVLAASFSAQRSGWLGVLVALLSLISLPVLGWLHARARDVRQVARLSVGTFRFVVGGLPALVAVAMALRQGRNAAIAFALAAPAGFAGVARTQRLPTRTSTGG